MTVTVPNNDLSDQYPEFYEGNQVTLDDSNIRDFLQHRDTDTEFSNEGRIERQKVYMSAYVDKIKSLDESKLIMVIDADAYKEELSKNETEEDLGDISITIPTDAPDNAAGKDTTSSSDKSSNTDSADSGSDSEK